MATFTIAGFTFDENDLVTDGSIIDGASRTLFFGSGLQFPELSDNTVGSLVGGSNSQSIALGSLFNRSTIELTWDAGSGPINQAGDDLVVYENGFARVPEDYAVAVRSTATGHFTPFRYEFFDSYDETAVNGPADGTGLFATAFDLSDFGLATGEAIDAIRIVSLLNNDTVDGADGQGVVTLNETSHLPFLGNLFDRPLSLGKSDPDITLVAGLTTGAALQPLQLFDVDNNLVGGFSTIQAAVDAAADGYTLLAAAGTYSEDVTLDKSLTLIGANFGLAGNDAARGAESILEGSFTLADDNISILGFEFTNNSAAIRGGSDGSVNFDNITIAFNDFVGLTDNNQTFITNGFGTGGAPSGGSNWSITDNYFDGITGNDASIMRIDNVDGLLIADNVGIHDNAGVVGRRGIQIDNSQNVEVLSNVVNLGVADFSNEIAAFTAARYNLQLSLDVDGSANSTANVTIADNTFSGAYDGIVTLDDRDLSAVDIVDNSFSNAFYGIRLAAAEGTTAQGTQSDIEISSNSFDAIVASAVAFDHREPTEAFADIVVENNTFSGEFAGVTHISGDTRNLAGTNIFEGSDGNDNLLGGTGDDALFGFGGNDFLDGDAGNNTAFGGDGIDTFGLFDGSGITTVLDFDPSVDKFTNAAFFDVIFAQGTGVEARTTFVLDATSFDAMAKLLLTDAVDITAANFV
ncbi:MULTISPECIES: hypothetical protein [Cyanophyceae]|uniref:Uncharacterized protein n=1 Tax=Leptolyngbya subtilissima DQ-A4 TaxID=2933933 RepID=A0ABV0K977_9CYAN|nr:hypothetical protein [Nodosilinea sp. FACHB-141]MBD2114249.1 hypothetical protein [Nodosilinea sp. FACHB-141]